MSLLARQQQALLNALFAWPADEATKNIAKFAQSAGAGDHRGLKTYQTNGHEQAARALQSAFPVLAQIVGLESFAALARAHWHAHPPGRGDWAQWGETLADFVAHSAQLMSEPYLPDVVRLEWALHQIQTAPDPTARPDTFSLLMSHDPNELLLLLAPGCTLLRSGWPMVSIVAAHQIDEPADQALAIEALAQKLETQTAEDAVVWREHYKPRLRQALPGEADFLQALLARRSLGEAVDSAPALDFAAWLPLAVQSGLLLGAGLRDRPDQHSA